MPFTILLGPRSRCRLQYLQPAYESAESAVQSQFHSREHGGRAECRVTSPTLSIVGEIYTPANTITLTPQTINGTVVATQPSGSFVDYTVSLASYDLFPALAVQQGQTTLLNNPSQIEVYVDSSTQTLNTQALAPGSTLRFYGLVFNDNATLRMDCAQVNDGVTATAQANSAVAVQGVTQTIRRDSSGLVLRAVTTTK